jgi:hypothetical protein
MPNWPVRASIGRRSSTELPNRSAAPCAISPGPSGRGTGGQHPGPRSCRSNHALPTVGPGPREPSAIVEGALRLRRSRPACLERDRPR